MATKSNGLLKILLGVAGAIAVGVIALAMGGRGNKNTANEKPNDVVYISEEEAKEFGLNITGDTPQDTLRTLLGAMKATRDEVKRANDENARLKSERDRLVDNEKNVEARIGQALSEQADKMTTMFQRQFDDYKEQMSGRTVVRPTEEEREDVSEELPIGGGQRGFKAENATDLGETAQVSGGTIWINPTDMKTTDSSGRIVPENTQGAKTTFSTPFKLENGADSGNTSQKNNAVPNTESKPKSSRTPFYTIPDNSTLVGATAMTALLGRVPINGTVTDAYPFKAIIGRDNLMANGIDLPDVEGAIVSGTASGDWTLSCVRADINSITFIFQDGRISNGLSKSNQSGSQSGKSKLGWLSDDAGLQCIPGERKTNAPEYLTSQFLLAGAGAAANGFAQGQTTATVQNGSVVGAVTGNQGRFILGQAIGGGLQEVENWYRQRYGQMFDAIYVKPGQQVAIHITEQLEIDYDTNSRKVKYHHSRRINGLD